MNRVTKILIVVVIATIVFFIVGAIVLGVGIHQQNNRKCKLCEGRIVSALASTNITSTCNSIESVVHYSANAPWFAWDNAYSDISSEASKQLMNWLAMNVRP